MPCHSGCMRDLFSMLDTGTWTEVRSLRIIAHPARWLCRIVQACYCSWYSLSQTPPADQRTVWGRETIHIIRQISGPAIPFDSQRDIKACIFSLVDMDKMQTGLRDESPVSRPPDHRYLPSEEQVYDAQQCQPASAEDKSKGFLEDSPSQRNRVVATPLNGRIRSQRPWS
jgi:hypothetical protein